ncbi:MAG: radical SAM protein [Nanobdellota archaeon]
MTFLDNSLVYVFGTKPRRAPLFVSWDIADTCNARCVFCNRWKMPAKGVSYDEQIAIIDMLGRSKVWSLSLCGGEPLLLDNLGSIVRRVKSWRMVLNISTNGSMLADRAKELRHVDSVTVSVDSDQPLEHDSNRGMPGLFDRIHEGMRVLERLERRPKISIRCIVHAENIDSIGRIVRYWRTYADEVLLQPVHLSPVIGYVPEKRFFAISDAQEKRFRDDMHRLGMADRYTMLIPSFIKNRGSVKQPCLSGFFFLEIDAQGILWNCSEHKVRLGDLTSQNLFDLLSRSRVSGCSCMHSSTMLNTYLAWLAKIRGVFQKKA